MEKYPRIRNLREDSDLTQQQIGEAINVPQRTYDYYESGQRMIHVVSQLFPQRGNAGRHRRSLLQAK
ncbi:MAG TPA: hypothetical protein DD735_04305 [Clostridiales bacterium]|nr:hypothetical protein [Clostridiales bacterium]